MSHERRKNRDHYDRQRKAFIVDLPESGNAETVVLREHCDDGVLFTSEQGCTLQFVDGFNPFVGPDVIRIEANVPYWAKLKSLHEIDTHHAFYKTLTFHTTALTLAAPAHHGGLKAAAGASASPSKKHVGTHNGGDDGEVIIEN